MNALQYLSNIVPSNSIIINETLYLILIVILFMSILQETRNIVYFSTQVMQSLKK
jgi:hypothetical protein